MSSRGLSTSRLRAATAALVVALALLPWLDVVTAHAATLDVPQGAGLTTPGGLAETPDGGLWATDAAAPRRPGLRELTVPRRIGLERLERPTVLFGASGQAR